MGIPCSKCGNDDTGSDEEYGFNGSRTNKKTKPTRGQKTTQVTSRATQTATRKQSELSTSRISINGSEYVFEYQNNVGQPPIIVVNNDRYERHHSDSRERLQSVKGDVFKCRYTPQSYEQIFKTQQRASSTGNFVDCRNIPVKNSVRVLQALAKWSHSVCQIRFGNGTATGFRVGSRYIMTAFHVVECIIKTGNPRCKQNDNHRQVTALEHPNVFCLFNYFDNIHHSRGNIDAKKFFFKAVLKFCNEQTDTAILELADHRDGFPPPFEIFGIPDFDGNFTFLGHMGSAMEYNTVDLIIDKDSETTKKDIQDVMEYNDNLTTRRFDVPPFSKLSNEHRILFHCKFGKGASGSPGILVQEDGSVVVVTILLRGYPDWYYGADIGKKLTDQWPKEYCIEQGANMISVESYLYDKNPDLYRDIFCRSILPSPDLW